MSGADRPGTHSHYAAQVPNAPRTPHRHLRVEDELWQRFSDSVAVAGRDRSTVLRDFMRWYARYPGTTMPKRPAPQKTSDPA